MGSIKINVGNVLTLSSQLQAANNIVYEVRGNLSSARRSIDGRILNRNNLFSRLQSVSSQLSSIEGRVSRIRGTVERGANNYRNADTLVTKWGTAVTNQFFGGISAVGNAALPLSGFNGKQTSDKTKIEKKSTDKFSLWSWSDTWKMIENAGIVGALLSTVGGAITGGISVKNGLKTAKGATKVIENIAKAIPKDSTASFDWKTLFGFNSAITKNAPKTFGKAFGESIEKLKFGNAKTVSDKVAVGAKWAGYGLTAIATTYDNFTDTTENNSTGRKIAESIGETTVKIGEGLVIGAGVTAAFAGAPAVVVGAVTVGVAWVGDKICEVVTDKDVAEFVSDSLLDFAKSKITSAGKVAKKVAGWWTKANGFSPLIFGIAN